MTKTTESQKDTLSQAYILRKISHLRNNKISSKSKAWEDVEPWVDKLVAKGYATFKSKTIFGQANVEITPKGLKVMDAFQKRYQNLIKVTEIYSAIDLENGVFAWEYWNTEQNPTIQEFQQYLQQDRWQDLRITVLQYFKFNTIEAVFLQKLQDEELNTTDPEEWGFNLLVDGFWSDIENIVNSQIKIDDLKHENESGEEILNNVITAAENLMVELTQESRLNVFGHNDPTDDINWFDSLTIKQVEDWSKPLEL